MRFGAKLAHDNVREGPKSNLRSFGMTGVGQVLNGEELK